MEILNNTVIVTITAAGAFSGFFLLFLAYAYYKIYRADKIAEEPEKNRREIFLHGSLNFNKR